MSDEIEGEIETYRRMNKSSNPNLEIERALARIEEQQHLMFNWVMVSGGVSFFF